MNKYFIYCRKSSEQEDRQILSLESQEKELLRIVREQKLHIAGVYKESGSAHIIGRKLFNEMLTRIENGEANGLIVWDESRIARNSLDGGKVIYMMDLDQIVEIIKPGKIYKNTPDDKSWLTMCFMMSKKDSDDKGVNVKRGLKTKAEKGWAPGSWAKPGYMWDKMAERGSKTLLKDPVRFPLIKKSWEYFLSGTYSVPQIWKKLNYEWGYISPTRKTTGGTHISKSQLYNIFTDPFYHGEFEYPEKSGNWYKGKHETMITKQDFELAQFYLGRKGKPRPRTHEFTYTGMIKCIDCQTMVTAEEKWQMMCSGCKYKFSSFGKNKCPRCLLLIEEMKAPKILHYVYYHCSKSKPQKCTQRSIRLEELEHQIEDILSKIQISDKFKNWALKYLKELNESELDDRTEFLTSLQANHNECVKKLDNLLTLKISPENADGSLLTDEEYKKRKAELLGQKVNLEEQLQNANNRIDTWMTKAEEAFNFGVNAKYWFARGTSEEKKKIFYALASNIYLNNQKLKIELNQPFFVFKELVEKEPSISATFEPTKNLTTISQLDSSWGQNNNLLRD